MRNATIWSSVKEDIHNPIEIYAPPRRNAPRYELKICPPSGSPKYAIVIGTVTESRRVNPKNAGST